MHCVKFQKDTSRSRLTTVAGRTGQRIFENVSAQAWKLWEERQKMILNEYRLMPWQKEAQELIGSIWKISSSEPVPRCHPVTCHSRLNTLNPAIRYRSEPVVSRVY